jgi:outer membrane usher protein
LRPNSLPKRGASRPARRNRWRLALLAGCSACLAPAAWASQEPGVTIGSGPAPTPAVAAKLNPTGRPINLTVPAKDGVYYLGEIAVTISPEDRVEFSSRRLLDLLANVLDPKVHEQLRTALTGHDTITPADLQGSGVTAAYNPQTIELALNIPPDLKAVRTLGISPLDRERIGLFERPATFSAFLNIRGSIDYVHQGVGEGWGDPVFFLDGASRYRDFVFESEGVWQPGQDEDFQRIGTRLVYDDLKNVARWTAGDLLTTARGFQSAPDMAGLSVFRSYGVLQPQRNISPRGDQTFRLVRPSTVEVFVNGQSVRRLRLDPGSYNVRDFPFTQGANDIRLAIEDDTGERQTLRFNVFFDRSQLGVGLSEFGLYAGAKSSLAPDGPDYDGDWAVSGFYRRGIAQNLTLGLNGQADADARMGGVEGVWGSRIGTIGFDLAASDLDGYGAGFAGTVNLQRQFRYGDGRADVLNLYAQSRSRDFAPMGVLTPDNRYEYELGAGYSHAFSDAFYASLDARYSKGRDDFADAGLYRASLGYRVSPTLGLTVDVMYDDAPGRHETAAFISLVKRISPWSSVRADYDTRDDRARVGYQALHGDGVGSYNVSADIERTPDSSGLNATANYFANRAELGMSHYTIFDGMFGGVTDQRTAVRVGTAIGFADGAVSVGRPIYDAFAVIQPHASLRQANVLLNPTPYGYAAETGRMGTALTGNLAAYSERTITIDAEGAAQGYDLGSGSYRLLPPYKAGYRLQAGSAYSVTAIGRLIDADGAPISLLGGKAIEMAHPEREPITIFTNREGRFGAAGLAPGIWKIEMPTQPASVFILTIPANTPGVLRAGDLKPTGQ